MSILIKGMEMPKNCMECPVVVCLKTKDDCPLVPVPPHGRLGDMDAIARKIRRLGDYVDFTKDEIAGWFENGDFETIIPAESITAEEEKK